MFKYPPRLELAKLPTPLTKLEKFNIPNFDGNLWVKRDELTGTEVSGNKIRKLEFSIAHALGEGCNTLITCGGVQSNHCRATAILGSQLGLKVHLILRGEKPALPEGNLLLDYLAGAEISFLSQDQWSDHENFAKELQQIYLGSGDKAHFIPIGASDEIGLWGYIAAFEELVEDFKDNDIEPDYIITATGSGGTQGGLIVGTRLFDSRAKIRAFNVCDSASYFEKKIREDVSLWKQRYKINFDEADLEISTLEGYMGPAYGEADDIVFETIANLSRAEGLFLDPVYTGKAFHGMISELQLGEQGQLPGSNNVVFVHTGGLFGIFPQQKRFKFN